MSVVAMALKAVYSCDCCGQLADTTQETIAASGNPSVFREVLPANWHVISGAICCSWTCGAEVARRVWEAPMRWEVRR
jgi:hypothetical protein